MDPDLRRAWTQIVTPEDYEAHMASIGQAQASAELARHLIRAACLAPNSRIVIVGAGTGQMFDFIDPAIFRPHRLTCTDLNPSFLTQLRKRLGKHGLAAEILADDIEQTALAPDSDLLMATLLLEHINWRCGVAALSRLKPRTCAIIIQENPPDISSAVTPGRRLPPSIEKAVETAHPVLVPRDELLEAMETASYALRDTAVREVADGKKLVSLLYDRLPGQP